MKTFKLSLSLLVLTLLVGSSVALAETETKAERAEEIATSQSLETYATYPIRIAAVKARRIYNKKFADRAPITEVLLEWEGKAVVYGVEFTQTDGNEVDVKINAETGKFVAIEDDRADTDEDEADDIDTPEIQASEKAESARLAPNAKLSESQAIKIANSTYTGNGRMTEVGLETEQGVIVYAIEFTEADGNEVDVKLNAKTGKILLIEDDKGRY